MHLSIVAHRALWGVEGGRERDGAGFEVLAHRYISVDFHKTTMNEIRQPVLREAVIDWAEGLHRWRPERLRQQGDRTHACAEPMFVYRCMRGDRDVGKHC